MDNIDPNNLPTPLPCDDVPKRLWIVPLGLLVILALVVWHTVDAAKTQQERRQRADYERSIR